MINVYLIHINFLENLITPCYCMLVLMCLMVYDCDVIYYSDQMLGRKHVKLFISYHVAPSWICNLPIISEGGVTSQIINYHANYDVFIYS